MTGWLAAGTGRARVEGSARSVRRAAIALTAVTIVLAGCGSSSKSEGGSGSSGPVPVTHRYLAALASNDGGTVCSLLTGEVKQRLLRGAVVLAALTHRSNPLSCPDDVGIAHELLGADQVAELRRASVAVVSQAGNSATVRVTLPGGRTSDVAVANTAAGWLINSAPAKLLGQRGATAPASSSPAATGSSEPESLSTYERQLAAGQIASVAINKRLRRLHITLKDGSQALALYPAHTFVTVTEALAAKGVPVTVLSPSLARREAASAAAE